jgi:hypothetical protein
MQERYTRFLSQIDKEENDDDDEEEEGESDVTVDKEKNEYENSKVGKKRKRREPIGFFDQNTPENPLQTTNSGEENAQPKQRTVKQKFTHTDPSTNGFPKI